MFAIGIATVIAIVLGVTHLYLHTNFREEGENEAAGPTENLVNFRAAEIRNTDDSGGWLPDLANSHLAEEVSCDLPIIDAKNVKWDKMSDPIVLAQMLQSPFIIRYLLASKHTRS